MTPKKINAFYEVHKEIENKLIIKNIEKNIAVTALFKIKKGFDSYRKMMLELWDNKI